MTTSEKLKSSVTTRLSVRVLTWLAGCILRRRQWFVWPQLVLFTLATLYTFKYLQFDTDRNALVGAEKRYHHNFLQFKKEFAAQNDLVVVVES